MVVLDIVDLVKQEWVVNAEHLVLEERLVGARVIAFLGAWL
jgi:hypothetical protein